MGKSLIQSIYIVHQKRELFTFSSVEPQDRTFLTKNKKEQASKKIICTVSGGQDSILLFFLLLHAQKTWNLTLHIVYCHHFWQFQNLYVFREIWKLTFLYQIPSSYFFSNDHQQTEHKASLWRQESYFRAAEVFDCENITLAHTASDGIETALWHIGRGTGPRGILNMRPKILYNTRHYNRISFERRRLKKYCTKNSSTNKIIKKEVRVNWLENIPVNPKIRNIFKRKSVSLVFFNNEIFENQYSIKEYNCLYNSVSCGHFSLQIPCQNDKNRSSLQTQTPGFLKKTRKNDYTYENSINLQLTKTLYYTNIVLNNIFGYSINRPLYNFHRSDVSFLVHQNSLPLIPDYTNKNIFFTRNRIRLKLIPNIRYFLNTNFDHHFWGYLELTNRQQKFLNNTMESILEGYCNSPESIKNMKKLPLVMQLECLHLLLKSYTLRQITTDHIIKLQSFLDFSD